jgi:superfamily II DNA or RNA helicase
MPETVLVIGEPSDEVASTLTGGLREVRWAATPFAASVQSGLYAIKRGANWHFVLCPNGAAAGVARQDELRRIEDGDALALADHLYELLWDRADAVGNEAPLENGAMVRRLGDERVGRVLGHRRVGAAFRYTVSVDGEEKEIFADGLVQITGDPRSPEFWIQQPVADAAQIGLTLSWTKLKHPLTDVLYSFQSSKTVFRAYQFRPVLKMLNGGQQRLLIADEVGLGKTIEAGLIWSELEQRTQLSRVLIVCPAALVLKWKAEMGRRFDRQVDVLSREHLTELIDALERGDGDKALIGVISLESLRGSPQLEKLVNLQPRFDLIIVDEAHYLRNRETKSYAVGRLLSDWADALIFLSATPLNLRSTDLFNLLNLLDEDHFGDIDVFDLQLEPNRRLNEVAGGLAREGWRAPKELVSVLDQIPAMALGRPLSERPDYGQLRRLLDTDRPLTHLEIAAAKRYLAELNTLTGLLSRTRKADVPDAKATRVPLNVDVVWTDQERAFYDAVWSWYSERAKSMGVPPGFAMQMPLRQAASCIPAMKQLLSEREPWMFQAAMADVDDVDESEVDPGTPAFDGLTEIDVLRAPLGVDSKFEQLLETLRAARSVDLSQVMIFSYFRRTLGYLQKRLSGEFSVRVMHGGVPMSEREEIMSDFRLGKFDLLLLSEVGSEGLDFEFCNVLVNYDLPWNPMRVEQRIGRLDRFGQKHEKIFIYNMRVPGTIETDIFQRLYDRIGLFESSIGELEPILRDELAGFHRLVLDPRLNTAQRQEQVQRVGVAIENRAQMVDEIRESQGLLAGADQLLIEGFESDSPGRGRFIGAGEIRVLVEALLARHGGKIRTESSNGRRLEITGTPELASRLLSMTDADHGTKIGRSRLAARLREGQPIEVTLSSEEASQWDVELLSSRHPLVRLAVDELGGDELSLRRFGRVRIPGLPVSKSYLVGMYLVETSGLRPQLELWGVAVDTDSGQVDTTVGEKLLSALAAGKLESTSLPVSDDLDSLLAISDEWTAQRQREVELERRLDNDALVESRLQSQRESFKLKIARATDTLETVLADGRDSSIARLHSGRIRHLKQRLAELDFDMAPKRYLTLSVQPVAVVLVGGDR